MYKKILIARCDAIGDMVLSLPVIDNLRAAYPEAEIYFLCRERVKDVLDGYPGIKEIIVDDYATGKIKTRRDFFEYAKRIRGYKFDLYVSLWQDRFYTYLGYFARIPKRLGPNDAYFTGKLYNLGYPLRERIMTKHMYELNLDLLKPLKMNISYHHPDLTKKIRPKHDPHRVAVAVGARGANKLWPPHNFIPVIKWLNSMGKKVILLGGPEEAAIGEQIATHFTPDQLENNVGKLPLAETMNKIAECSLFLGSDSGPMHVAAALKLPVVAFFFTKNQKVLRWGPLTRHIILRNNYYCPVVCRSCECNDKTCIESVTPEETISALQKIMEGGGYSEPRETFTYWCQKTMNILFLEKGWGKNGMPNILKSYGFNVYVKPAGSSIKFLNDFIIANNINIIHVLANSVGPKEKFLQILASNYVPNFPLLCKNPRREPADLDGILSYYRSEFEKL
ncbi:MAG TPA: glycosyltransferase family 9 protein [Candidatus Omnitrophota bacterium]|nr:glycosyltransferase family 9 protein [Candidatus Omnitrophota bacterium]